MFFIFVLAFTLTVLGDGLRWQFLIAVYPITTNLITLAFLLPLGIQMLRTKNPSRVFYDSERGEFGEEVDPKSNERYLLWLAGMLAVSALAGFVPLLGVLSHLLSLEYPQGILQDYVTLPWPLQ